MVHVDYFGAKLIDSLNFTLFLIPLHNRNDPIGDERITKLLDNFQKYLPQTEGVINLYSSADVIITDYPRLQHQAYHVDTN